MFKHIICVLYLWNSVYIFDYTVWSVVYFLIKIFLTKIYRFPFLDLLVGENEQKFDGFSYERNSYKNDFAKNQFRSQKLNRKNLFVERKSSEIMKDENYEQKG